MSGTANNRICSVLPTSGNQAILAPGLTLAALQPGQLGFFSHGSNISLDGTEMSAKTFYMRLKAPNGDLLMSAGPRVQAKNIKKFNTTCYQAPKPQVWDITDFKATCEETYSIMVGFKNEYLQSFSSNLYPYSVYSVTTGCCEPCVECPTGDCIELVEMMNEKINTTEADNDGFLKSSIIDNEGNVIVDLEAYRAANTNAEGEITACPGIRLCTIPSKLLAFCNVNPNYDYPRGTNITVGLLAGFDCNGKVEVKQDLTYEQGNGFDISEWEWNHTSENQHRTSRYVLHATDPFMTQHTRYTDPNQKYNQIDITHDDESYSGTIMYDNYNHTKLAIPCGDDVTWAGVLGFFSNIATHHNNIMQEFVENTCTGCETVYEDCCEFVDNGGGNTDPVAPTIIIDQVTIDGNKEVVMGTGTGVSDYRVSVDGTIITDWTPGTNSIYSVLGSLPDGGTVTVDVRNSNGDIATDTWVRPDGCFTMNFKGYTDVNVNFTVNAFDTLIESPTNSSTLEVVYEVYQDDIYVNSFNFVITDANSVFTQTLDVTQIGIDTGNLTITSRVYDSIGTELVGCTEEHTCISDSLIPIAANNTISGGGISDTTITQNFYSVSNFFNDVSQFLGGEMKVTVLNFTNNSTTEFSDEVLIVSDPQDNTNISPNYTSNYKDIIVLTYKATNLCGEDVTVMGSNVFIANNEGTNQSEGFELTVNPSQFISNPVQIGFKGFAKTELSAGVYGKIVVSSQSGVRSIGPNYADFNTFEWTISNTTTGESGTSGVVSGYSGALFETTLPSNFSVNDNITVTLVVTDTLGNSNTGSYTFVIT